MTDNGINVPIIGSIPVVGSIVNWFADIGALGVNAVVNTGKTVAHSVGSGLNTIPIFAKWGGLIGLGVGAYQASQEGKDMLSGALDGAMKGLVGGAAVGGGVGLVKGALEGGIPTLQQVGQDASVVASGLFPTAPEVPNVKPPSPQNGQGVG
jgi:hypothetical protein